MVHSQTSNCIPDLRFPEFQNNGEWEEKRLGDCFTERVERNYIDLPLLSLTESDGIVLQEETNRKNNSNTDKSKYLRVCIGDIAYNTMRMWQGRCAFATIEGIVSPAYTICKPNKDMHSLYFYYLFRTKQAIELFHKNSQGLVNDTLNLKYENFAKIKMAVPSLVEQKRIAECLSSVDEMIVECINKLELLKSHKKGLMQKLFPAKGQKVPELRFREFKKDGEWEEKKLGELFDRITRRNKESNQNVLTISAQYGLVSQYDYFNKNVAALDVTNYYLINKGDFAYNKSRSQGHPYGAIKSLRLYDKGVVSTLYICFRIKKDVNCSIDFFEHYFETDLINDEIGRIAQEGARNHGLLNISTDDFFNKVSIIVPSLSEQKKIADCLSSIDNMISYYTEKLSLLEQHKKGLMQLLFPNYNR